MTPSKRQTREPRERRHGRTRNAELEDSLTQQEQEEAEDLSRRFHGRDPKEVFELVEEESYPSNLAELGELIELTVLDAEGTSAVPIDFDDAEVGVCAHKDNIYFVGGDQELDEDDLNDILREIGIGEYPKDRHLCYIGEVFSIVYFTDKHHLSGPKAQQDGMEYEHEFGEEGGDLPSLVYDTRNKKLLLVGGSYEIRDEGIWN